MTVLRLTIGLLSAVFTMAAAAAPGAADGAGPCPPLLDRSLPSLQDEAVPLCRFSGKVLLIVNTASQCGYTPQYEGLESLYRRYRDRGLVVLGFPGNDFGGQEPGSNKQIAQFCEVNYGVTFPMFAKTSVVGATANPLFRELTLKTGKRPQWNFNKYLVDRKGEPIAAFGATVEPTDPKFVAQIERLLDAR